MNDPRTLTKLRIVLFMLGEPINRWTLLSQILEFYGFEYAGFDGEGGFLADTSQSREDLQSEWKLAIIETLNHFERPDVRAKSLEKPLRYGYFLTKCVWTFKQNLEKAGFIDARPHIKYDRDENGKRIKPQKLPARHGRATTASLDVMCSRKRYQPGSGGVPFDIATLPEYEEDHAGY